MSAGLTIVRSLPLRLYGILTWMLQPLLRYKLQQRARTEPGYGFAVPERFGHYDGDAQEANHHDWFWVHAVSLGEVRAAGILITELRRQHPNLRLLLTHGTATGREEGAKLLQPGDQQVWQPWDAPGPVARFLDHFSPRLGILMETEVWPELCAACAERSIPLVLANARLNEKSLAGAKRLSWLARPAYASLTAVWAQTEIDAHRLVAAGAKVSGVFGNLKFDATPDAQQLARANALRELLSKPVIVLASSREGEERQLLEVLQRLYSGTPVPRVPGAPRATMSPIDQVQWMIVPRHPQRFDEVAALVQEYGFTVVRRTNADGEARTGTEIWLGDSLGEMALYYGLADVALLGGSFEPLGGQNLIEAAACGCPVVMGPSTFNFSSAAELSAAAGAALRADNMEQAVAIALTLAGDPARRGAMVDAALGFSSSNRGATARTVAAITAIIAADAVRRVDDDASALSA